MMRAAELAELHSTQAELAGVTHHLTNCGYARACNDAANWHITATGEYLGTGMTARTLAFFNADTRIRPGVLEKCVDLLESDPTYAIVGPRQVDDENKITHSGIYGTLEAPKH